MGAEEFTIATYHRHVAEHRIMASRCTRCNTLYLPPRPICPLCHTQEMTWAQLKGEGKVVGFTSIFVPPTAMAAKGFGRHNPYLTGIIQMEEGPTIAARIIGADPWNPAESIHVDMPVQVDFLEEGEGEERHTVLAFRPTAASQGKKQEHHVAGLKQPAGG